MFWVITGVAINLNQAVADNSDVFRVSSTWVFDTAIVDNSDDFIPNLEIGVITGVCPAS